MHQTFYIDIDEEITSIVERIKKAQTKEIIMVVPKRALLIQSIVNLRILKKEADEINLQLIIVTQDKLGKILIEKAGILVQPKIDKSEEEIKVVEKKAAVNLNNDYKEITEIENKEKEEKNRLDNIGSRDYFNEENKSENQFAQEWEKAKEIENDIEKKPSSPNYKDSITKISEGIQFKKTSQKINLKEEKESKNIFLKPKNKKSLAELTVNQNKKKERKKNIILKDNSETFSCPLPVNQNEKIENFFKQSNDYKKSKDNYQNYNISRKTRRLFWIFGLIGITVVLGIGAYLFIPKATVTIMAKTESKSIDSEVLGKTNIKKIDYNKEVIPARFITVNQQITKEYNSTGSKVVSNQKAQGTVIIYNEYGPKPQPLIATTRILSASGKLFRLKAGIVVPGFTKEGGKVKPGSVEAIVVADSSGEDYNISPTNFTIPGFQNSGGDKYHKFYAKSNQAMTGGGNGTKKVGTITERDIALAKKKTLKDLNKLVDGKIKKLAGEEAVVLDDAVEKDEATYRLSNSAGDIVDSFNITIQMEAKAIIIQRADLRQVVAQILSLAGDSAKKIDSHSVLLDFGKADVNFQTGTINIRFHASGKTITGIDTAKIKNNILGKSENDLEAYLSTIPNIEKVAIVYWPSFMSGRIPFQKSRVKVLLDN